MTLPRFAPGAILYCFLTCFASTLRAEPVPDGSSTEFERMLSGFGTMETVAGRLIGGFAAGSDSCNDWNAAWEGGPATNADLSRPHMAQADAAGNIYIADKEGQAIRKVSVEGAITTLAGNGLRGDGGEGVAKQISLREPNGLYTFPDGTTYLVEIIDDCEDPPPEPIPGGKIRRIGTDGMMTTVFTDPTLSTGRGLWVSPDESLIYYCSGSEVRKWTPTGGIETYSTGYVSLGNMAMDPDGLLVVADRSTRFIESGHYVYRLSADGTKTIIAGNGTTSGGGHGLAATATGLNEVRGVAIRPDGSMFVCTHRRSQVWFIDTAGLIWLTVDGNSSGSTHGGDGEPLTTATLKISEPRAVILAPNGDMLITENDDGYIRRVTNICVPPVITKISHDAGGVTLTWRSHRQGQYHIEQSTDLINWSPAFDPETGPGSTTTATVGGGAPAAFFRVVETLPD